MSESVTFARDYMGVGGGEISVVLIPPGYVQIVCWRGGLGVKVTLDAKDTQSVLDLLQRSVAR